MCLADQKVAVAVPPGQEVALGTYRQLRQRQRSLSRVAGHPDDVDASDMGDDDDVDLSDFATFAVRFGGSAVALPPPGCSPASFAGSDLDGGGDVDLGEFSTFSTVYTG